MVIPRTLHSELSLGAFADAGGTSVAPQDMSSPKMATSLSRLESKVDESGQS